MLTINQGPVHAVWVMMMSEREIKLQSNSANGMNQNCACYSKHSMDCYLNDYFIMFNNNDLLCRLIGGQK